MYYLKKFCFLCLKPGISTTLHNVDVEEKLEYLVSTYQVLQLSRIPKHFCDNCLENLNSFYDFKHKCVKSIIISNYYVQKLTQENGTFACLSVRLSDILHNIELHTGNSIDDNVESMNNKLNEEIFEIGSYEQHETVEIQPGKASKEQVSIKIENETDYFEIKREITEELIIKDENSDSDNNDYIFECKTCMLSFSTEVLSVEHIAGCKNRTRPIEGLNQIPSVTESDNNSDTSIHIEGSPYSFSRVYKCNVCKKTFNRKYNLKQHERIHTDQKPYKCNVCKRTFNRKSNLEQHERIHTGQKPYKCDVCKRTFNRVFCLNQHKRIHTREKSYKCDVCKKTFSYESHLNAHKRIHTGEKPYKYNVFKKTSNRKYDLEEHERIHTGKKLYQCDVCKKTFRYECHLNAHKRIHTGQRPYKCDVCKKTFNQNSHLNQHERIHTGDKPHECDVCKKSFNLKHDLTRHRRLHTGERPYKCNVCTRTFNRKYHMHQHERIHTREKPYECDVCRRTLSSKPNLKRHKSTQHG